MKGLENIKSDGIVKFWNWFESVSEELLVNPTREDLIHQIDGFINKLGPFDWEIGPWKNDTYYFAISPNLDVDRLGFTREFVKKAPKCTGWHFLHSKPVKNDWQGIWNMKNQLGKEILINSSNWEYVLYQFEDETFDMDIIIDGVDGNNDTINIAIDIALTGYLGEETFMRLIKSIKIVSFSKEKHTNKTTLLKHIKKHINSLRP